MPQATRARNELIGGKSATPNLDREVQLPGSSEKTLGVNLVNLASTLTTKVISNFREAHIWNCWWQVV
jgi:hypothetical protein